MPDGSISERARAKPNGVSNVQRDPHDLDRLREEWRIKAHEWAQAEDNAARLEEGRKILLAELRLALLEQGERATRVDDMARVSEQFKGYARKMHDARRLANDLRIEMVNADRAYWQQNSIEATGRAEMRMSR